MRCTNKKIISLILIIVLISGNLVACGKSNATYNTYENSYEYGILRTSSSNSSNLMGARVAIAPSKDLGTDLVDSQVATGAILVNRTTNEVNYSQNCYKKLYPASTTKILTALICIKYADLDDTVKVSEYACEQGSDSSVCNLNPGDVISYRQLLYGLMLRSGNDAAIAIAEGMAGSCDEFAKMMNKEAKAIGATNSHFITPNGLHDDDHYTTVYDMYLIYNKALEYQEFYDISSASSFSAYYTDKDGSAVQQEWTNTNGYLGDRYKAPEGISVIGGKTGTTHEARYCLVLLSKNTRNEELISIVYDADCRNNLYYLMNQILYNFGNQ